jgi:hypothetical protein
MEKRTINVSSEIFRLLSDGKRVFVTKFYPDISINDRISLIEDEFPDTKKRRGTLEVEVVSIQTEIAGLKSNECILGVNPV